MSSTTLSAIIREMSPAQRALRTAGIGPAEQISSQITPAFLKQSAYCMSLCSMCSVSHLFMRVAHLHGGKQASLLVAFLEVRDLFGLKALWEAICCGVPVSRTSA